jgi:hypothetical protein
VVVEATVEEVAASVVVVVVGSAGADPQASNIANEAA